MAQAVNIALSSSSNNSNGVSPLNLTPAPAYDPQQILTLMNAYNELLTALRR